MILTKDVLTKALNKGRMEAESLLRRVAFAGGLPAPRYDSEYNGDRSYPSHICQIRFQVPQFLKDDERYSLGIESTTVIGEGRSTTKKAARTLASLEVVHLLQEEAGLPLGGLEKHMREWEVMNKRLHEEIEGAPVDDNLRGSSWSRFRIDPSFDSRDRTGRIRFFPQLVSNPRAFATAKALTLQCQEKLPEVLHYSKHRNKFGEVMPFANIRPNCGPKSKIILGPQDASIRDKDTAEIKVLLKAYKKYGRPLRRKQEEDVIPSSFGMAKIFTRFPKDLFADVKVLLDQVAHPYDERNDKGMENITLEKKHPKRISEVIEDEKLLESRVQTFKNSQELTPLPVDLVSIPHNAAVTILQGGTGSGKTSRYPLMLSLFSPTGPRTKVLVAEPRRLACQAAARRVAYEQNVTLGSHGSPIGYSIRFESIPSNAHQRTVDFETPGVILRKAQEDPTLSDVTHIVLDEVHERRADMDLLVTLVKEAQKLRPPDNPLRVILMSATLDTTVWEKYFDSHDAVIIDVPAERQFPVDIIHLGEKRFREMKLESASVVNKCCGNATERNHVLERITRHAKQLEDSKSDIEICEYSYDEIDICSASAELATMLITREEMSNGGNGGTILVFLPGMDEIKAVDRMIAANAKKQQIDRPVVQYLHSSLSLAEQQKVFIPGNKIILSTNIAETSVTIPNVKVVIDTGKEKEFSILNNSANEGWMSAVGSQLATVNISQVAAQQRSGRAGRLSAGTCYRLYSRNTFENEFAAHSKPEMLRVDLAQMILHLLSMYQSESGQSLELLLRTPNPPALAKIQQTLRTLKSQGLVNGEINTGSVYLTPLGQAVSSLPTSPRIGRMIYMGLVIRAVDPALQIAALLSVPNVFQRDKCLEQDQHTSDVAHMMEIYKMHIKQGGSQKQRITTLDKKFRHVSYVENQLKHALMDVMKRQNTADIDWSEWNTNSSRLAAVVALVCNATPHIAHMVGDKNDFATRDIAGNAKIHPGSCNFSPEFRSHWYLYNELRTTNAPYLHMTTAVSPLELALFAEATSFDEYKDDFMKYKGNDDKDGNCLFLADQWVPVVMIGKRNIYFDKLRRLVSHDLLKMIAHDPGQVISNPLYGRIILYVFSAIEQHRVYKRS